MTFLITHTHSDMPALSTPLPHIRTKWAPLQGAVTLYKKARKPVKCHSVSRLAFCISTIITITLLIIALHIQLCRTNRFMYGEHTDKAH